MNAQAWFRAHCVALALAVAAGALPASAESGAPALKEAESAYQRIDFETMRDKARAAIEAGGLDRKQLTRAYFLLGVAASQLDDEEVAEDAFLRMLALDPTLKAEQALAPTKRTPILQAKGRFNGEALTAETGINAAAGTVVVRLSDPVGLADKVQLTARVDPEQDFEVFEAPAGPEVPVAVKGLKESGVVYYVLEVVDEHGNTLYAEGSRALPKQLGQKKADKGGTIIIREGGGPRSPVPYYIAAGVLGGLGLVAGGIGVPFYLTREDKAEEWNGPGCEVPGAGTRDQQCSDVDSDRQSAETAMVALWATGGALVLAGGVTLMFTPGLLFGGEQEEPPGRTPKAGRSGSVRCGMGPGFVGLACGGRF